MMYRIHPALIVVAAALACTAPLVPGTARPPTVVVPIPSAVALATEPTISDSQVATETDAAATAASPPAGGDAGTASTPGEPQATGTEAPATAAPPTAAVKTATPVAGAASSTPTARISPTAVPPTHTAIATTAPTLTFTPTRTATGPPPSNTPRPPTATHTATFVPPTATPSFTPEPATATSTGCPATGNASFEATLISLINNERAGRGLGLLSEQGQLTAAARIHSTDMACNNFFSHTGSDGSSPFDRMAAQGYGFSAAAENLYGGSGPFNSPQAAFDSWMNSAGHRDNMLDPDFVHIGVGYMFNSSSTFGSYWTAKFGAP